MVRPLKITGISNSVSPHEWFYNSETKNKDRKMQCFYLSQQCNNIIGGKIAQI